MKLYEDIKKQATKMEKGDISKKEENKLARNLILLGVDVAESLDSIAQSLDTIAEK